MRRRSGFLMSARVTNSDSPLPSRFVVGLDLGTTNSAMAYVDTSQRPRRIETFVVPQVVAPGHIEGRETLPSFHYQPASHEFPPGSFQLPWGSDANQIVGHFARDHGTLVPGRMIASAKSWICHSGVDRTSDLLPWQGADDVDRLSPVTVSARYLQHFRNAWDHRFPGDPLSQQDFVLTIPASFDEVARELTIKAAKQAGLDRVVLIEEPQAAFYAWIDKHAKNWDGLVTPGQTILVCDVGGGTSDFTLIRVRKGTDGQVQFHRVAVGEHLILGGDNLDLALAHHLEKRVKQDGQLEPRQWGVLVRSCRQLKEVLLGPNAPDQWTLTIPGSGSKRIGGSIQVPVKREEVESVLVEGFFPKVAFDAKPVASQSGFQEFGLPYAADAAVTKYVAAFLNAHQETGNAERNSSNPSGDERLPQLAILFNGGVFSSPILRQRLVDVVKDWYGQFDPPWTVTELDNERLDIAVARGAAYYGMVRRGEGVKIAAGLPRTYYVGVEATSKPEHAAGDNPAPVVSALCLLPAGIEPGHEVDLTQHQFQLLVSQPIEFPLFVSSTRLTDRPGDLVAIDPEQIKALPPIRTVLKTGKSKEAATVPIILKAKLTEIGTLDLWCSEVDGKRSWKLLFDVRSATQTDLAAHDAAGESQGLFDEDVLESARNVIRETFGGATAATPRSIDSQDQVASVVKRLEAVLGMPRSEWPTSLLRQLWESLIECESGRGRGAQHESRWLNLVGFSLRPGYGLAVDDWRCNETWKRLQGKLIFDSTASRAEWYILWRRVAGGLTAGQQQALAAPLISQIKQVVRNPTTKGRGVEFGNNTHESSELLRLLGASELLTNAVKQEIGDLLFELIERPRLAALVPAALWAIGRIGARKPVYGPLNHVPSAETAARWVSKLTGLKFHDPMVAFATMQLARKTGDRYRDLDEGARARVMTFLDQQASPAHFKELVASVTTLASEDQSLVFGESLPKGLRIS